MTRAEVIAAIGQPDLNSASPDGRVWYVFPRDLRDRVRRNPVPLKKFRHDQLAVIFRNQKVAAIYAQDNSKLMPYSFSGIAISRPFKTLQNRWGEPTWNNSMDIGLFYPLPLQVGVDLESGQLAEILIADSDDNLGFPALRFEFGRLGKGEPVSDFSLADE